MPLDPHMQHMHLATARSLKWPQKTHLVVVQHCQVAITRDWSQNCYKLIVNNEVCHQTKLWGQSYFFVHYLPVYFQEGVPHLSPITGLISVQRCFDLTSYDRCYLHIYVFAHWCNYLGCPTTCRFTIDIVCCIKSTPLIIPHRTITFGLGKVQENRSNRLGWLLKGAGREINCAAS